MEAKKHQIKSRLASVELPINVVNEDRALTMLGGPEKVARAIKNSDKLELQFRPEDHFAHPVNSVLSNDQHVLLEVKLSKKLLEKHNGDVRAALKAQEQETGKSSDYKCHHISSTQRFREMADFQWCTKNSPFVHKVEASLFAGDLQRIKELELEGPGDLTSVEIDSIPPPRFSLIHYPFPYYYKQNPMVTVVKDGSSTKLVNANAAPKLYSWVLTATDPAPTGPRKELAPLPEPDAEMDTSNGDARRDYSGKPAQQVHEKLLRQCVDELQELFRERPLWTRQGLRHYVNNPELKHILRFALPYVAYYFRSGPWRGAYVVYGKDPRTDPSMRFYQTEAFRISDNQDEKTEKVEDDLAGLAPPVQPAAQKALPLPYVFDGIHPPESQTLQLCDITDPLLYEKIHSAPVRAKYDVLDGWFEYNDISKIRKALRAKVRGTILRENSNETVQAIFDAEEEQRPEGDVEENQVAEDDEEDVVEVVDPEMQPETTEAAVITESSSEPPVEDPDLNMFSLHLNNVKSLRDLSGISQQRIDDKDKDKDTGKDEGKGEGNGEGKGEGKDEDKEW
ncbi:RNA polymerase III transcription factor IIIC subunit-domain-containing protein [Yarrowia lipolytica]|uniref:RNA polymerase III transcription factor IIIC subunit-domain-containing protein n=1 Tax=Yarrowia lipolytica TaxID=4952 RepID=A0A1D8NIG2_YARLL|nr:hypothetical protein YALI1_E17613g [Yarrowia lipolytica]KAB8282077.1 RNA polymerase III transcription factor IIIC subunit-domain-containing protein [Yarrowia lipolytica]KAE8171123.1 RNA polymerase III transcription factor IIIC subunit-domain-containing protein [Yarrowia lipolytica]KAJ8056928.1 RNA polymerase III transcription factor IIIC subunit-domain-containing protein [Yarrowia lipolytica]RMI96316.1 RNA polymerase III transcription factor IIIC subunit-domain-containing protein [Yarrowia l